MNALTENDSLFNYRPVRSIPSWDPVPNVARYNVYNQVKIHQNPPTFTYKAQYLFTLQLADLIHTKTKV